MTPNPEIMNVYEQNLHQRLIRSSNKTKTLKIEPQKEEVKYFTKFNCVYFIKSKGFIKIGHSDCLYRRLYSISTSNPTIELKGVLIRENHIAFEEYLHSKFRSDHHSGEWYRETNKLNEYISQSMGENESLITLEYNEYLISKSKQKQKRLKEKPRVSGIIDKCEVIQIIIRNEDDVLYLKNQKLTPNESYVQVITRILYEHETAMRKSCSEDLIVTKTCLRTPNGVAYVD